LNHNHTFSGMLLMSREYSSSLKITNTTGVHIFISIHFLHDSLLPHGMCCSHFGNGVRNRAISITQWGFINDCYNDVRRFLCFFDPPSPPNLTLSNFSTCTYFMMSDFDPPAPPCGEWPRCTRPSLNVSRGISSTHSLCRADGK
jgi:hypothetical protein